LGNVIYYDFENFRLDVINEQLLKDNQPIQLTHKAFKTLLILVQNFGQLVKKEDIINQIWHDSFVEDSNLTQHIYILRKALGNNRQGKPFIETVPKRGYCFVGEIQTVNAREGIPVQTTVTTHLRNDDAVLDEQFIFDERIHFSGDVHRSADSPSNLTAPVRSARKNSFTKPVLLVVGLVALIGVVFFFYRMFQTPAESAINSIAVLPFKPIGQAGSDATMGFGLADAVITSLSKQQKIPVRPTSAVFQFTEKNFDSVEVGKKLSVDSVLEGTIQRDGELVRVSVKLIKISDGSTIWAETFDEKLTSIFAVQDSISTKVAKSLMLNLSQAQEEQLTARNTSNAEAYLAYQHGRYFWNKRSKSDLEKAAGYFQQAIELDNNYAIAYAMLADCYNMLHYYRFSANSEETINQADEAAKKALLLNDSLPEAQIAISYVQIAKYRNYTASVQALERALQLSPYNATARIRYGWQMLRIGNQDEALKQMRIAQENDPLSPISNSAFCSMLLLKRNYREGLKYCEKAVDLMPTAPAIKIQLAAAHFLNNNISEAIQILQEEINVPNSKYDALAGLAYIYAKTGKTKEAEEIFVRLKAEIDISNKYSDLALVAFSLGRKEESVGHFKQMLKRQNNIILLSMLSDPFWEEVFRDEIYKQTIAEHQKKP
jgi:TolB-like protein/DNA-binding winged helix-turn-helix (wHTH) protein/Tfp pilus assembly protein PilF